MPRITVDLPEHFTFRTELPLLISQINDAGHLDNAQVLVLVGEARLRFLHSLGYRSDTDIDGLGLIVTDHAVQYRSEAFHGETMVIEMDANDFNKRGCDLVWRMSATGRPEGESRSAQHAGTPMSATGRPEGESRRAQHAGPPTSKLAAGREVARGKTGIVFFDYRTRQVAELPAGFRARWP